LEMPTDFRSTMALVFAHLLAPALVMGAPVFLMGFAYPFIAALVLRRDGTRSFLRSLLQYANARWWLRKSTSMGTVRLVGRARVENYGRLSFGDRVRLNGRSVRLDFGVGPGATLAIADGTYINYGSNISALLSVQIGQDCEIGQYAIIMDSNYHQSVDHRLADVPTPVVIEDDVWMGARVTVLPGSRIGRGAVIGAHSVVRGEIPPRSLAAGMPARVIRSLDAPR